MTATLDRYANWKAPAEDRQFLIWPTPDRIIQDALDNHRQLAAAGVLIQNIPLSELRSAQRKAVGHENIDQPLIASGHQTELYHPGVWVKDVLANAIAPKVNGQAYHFAVDTDQPKHLNLRWPNATFPITDDPALTTAEWAGLLACPTPDYLASIENRLAAQPWSFEPMTTKVLAAMRHQCQQSPTLAEVLTNAEHDLDQELGLHHRALLVSPILQTDPYLAFAHHLLARPESFAHDYNSALKTYRDSAGITSATRPMPDLQLTTGSIETPFWLDDLSTNSRTRATVQRSANTWVLRNGSSEFPLDPTSNGLFAAQKLQAWLQQNSLRLSPRALTLTTFLRLLLADQFIHGIGGGRYDQVTDLLIEKHFRITPPRFAVTTATMLFPETVGRSRVCLSCIAQEGHRLRHNLLGNRKTELLSELNSLPRRSTQRSIIFHNMHSALATAAANHPDVKNWETRYQQAEQQDRQDQILFDRELFYAIQSRDRLKEMITQYQTTLKTNNPFSPA